MKSKFLHITLMLVLGMVLSTYAGPPPPPPGLPIDGGIGFLFVVGALIGVKKIIKK